MAETNGARADGAARVAKDARQLLDAMSCGFYHDRDLTVEYEGNGLSVSVVVYREAAGEVDRFTPGGWMDYLRSLNRNAFALQEEARRPGPDVDFDWISEQGEETAT